MAVTKKNTMKSLTQYQLGNCFPTTIRFFFFRERNVKKFIGTQPYFDYSKSPTGENDAISSCITYIHNEVETQITLRDRINK